MEVQNEGAGQGAARERAVRVIEVRQSVFASNDRAADKLRSELQERGTFLLNLMSSPGSGKTTTLRRTVEALAPSLSMGVMEADIDSDVDARAMAEAGVPAVQLHTGGMCHLDAAMCHQGLAELDAAVRDAGRDHLDLAILENVGNLVCPAEFDTGASVNVAILSVPEGDDKPLKYPLMFEVCDLVLVNKMDVAPYFDFSLARCEENVRLRNPEARVLPISAKTGEGVEAWAAWLADAVARWQAGTFSKAAPANTAAAHYPVA
ncbi:hydrogenase nickel incorporation protein HypB [Olsenella uli]|uniref:hydrogenase nickel incorporation protein HypB n=1 Tax=Olsenella uli TaxID=133926 RepID=UPI0012AB9D55|nr:hydrogenase nickel incorporation protein HypB [Olsenella uli]